MTTRRKTPFERRLADKRRNPAYDAIYSEARREIDEVDRIIRALDAARVAAKLNKAELARRIGAAPVTLRRLFTAEAQNPSAALLAKIAHEVGLEIVLQPVVPRRRGDARRVAV